MRATNIFFCVLFMALGRVPARGAESLAIDLGATDPDPACSGGTRWDVVNPPAGVDATLRFTKTVSGVSQPFTCTLSAEAGVPYRVTLGFMEPGSAAGPNLRVFSVSMNGKTVVDRLDVWKIGGTLKMVERHFLEFPLDGKFTFTYFLPVGGVKSAIGSYIKVDPLSTLVGSTTPPATFTLKHESDFVPVRQTDGTYWVIPGFGEQVVNLSVFRNGVFATQTGADNVAADYWVSDVPGQPTIAEIVPNSEWSSSDVVRVTFDRLTFPLTAAVPWCYANVRPGAGWAYNSNVTCDKIAGVQGIQVAEWRSCRSGLVLAGPIGPGVPPGAMWPGVTKGADFQPDGIPGTYAYSCDGLQAYSFRLPDGTVTPPYVAVAMPTDFALDPAFWRLQ